VIESKCSSCGKKPNVPDGKAKKGRKRGLRTMSTSRLMGMLATLTVVSLVLAQTAVPRYKSTKVKRAKATFDNEIEEIEQSYAKELATLAQQKDQKVEAARRRLTTVIDAEIKAAMRKEDLDEAVALRALKNAVTENLHVVTLPKGAVEFKGHWYVVSNDSVSQGEASEKCEAIGGTLARIQSAEEQAFIEELIRKKGRRKHYWLDGTDEQQEGVWLFSDGTKLTYFNWGSGQPNNVDGREHGLVLQRSDGKWLDSEQSLKQGAVCEIVLQDVADPTP
jgi:hypothetical protein